MQNLPIRIGPVALTTTMTTNIYNPPTLTGGVGAALDTNTVAFISEIHLMDKGGTAGSTVNLFLGLTGANTAGTEIGGKAIPITVNQDNVLRFNPPLRVRVTDFLVGGCNNATEVTFLGLGVLQVCE
jgi:hypothetical protein